MIWHLKFHNSINSNKNINLTFKNSRYFANNQRPKPKESFPQLLNNICHFIRAFYKPATINFLWRYMEWRWRFLFKPFTIALFHNFLGSILRGDNPLINASAASVSDIEKNPGNDVLKKTTVFLCFPLFSARFPPILQWFSFFIIRL